MQTVEEREGLIEHFGANGACQFFLEIQQPRFWGSCHFLFDYDQAQYRAYKPDYIFVLGEKRWRSGIFSMDLSANVASPNVSNEGEDKGTLHLANAMQRRPSASILNVDYYMTAMCV